MTIHSKSLTIPGTHNFYIMLPFESEMKASERPTVQFLERQSAAVSWQGAVLLKAGVITRSIWQLVTYFGVIQRVLELQILILTNHIRVQLKKQNKKS